MDVSVLVQPPKIFNQDFEFWKYSNSFLPSIIFVVFGQQSVYLRIISLPKPLKRNCHGHYVLLPFSQVFSIKCIVFVVKRLSSASISSVASALVHPLKIGRWVLGGCRWDKCCCFLHYFKLTMVQKKEEAEEVSLCPQSLQTQNTFGYRKHHKMDRSSSSLYVQLSKKKHHHWLKSSVFPKYHLRFSAWLFQACINRIGNGMQFNWSLIIFCFQEFHEFKYVTLDLTHFIHTCTFLLLISHM